MYTFFINKECFHIISNTQNLWLNGNNLVSIDCGAFWDLQALQELRLFRNDLQTIHECVFDLQAHPADLDLYLFDNPWICNEELSWLVDEDNSWLKLEDWTGIFPQCSSPDDLAGCDLHTLTTKQLQNTTSQSGQYIFANR